MGVDIDEAGTDDRAACINGPLRFCFIQLSDRGDTVSGQTNVGPPSRTSGPVDHSPTGQQPVEHIRSFVLILTHVR